MKPLFPMAGVALAALLAACGGTVREPADPQLDLVDGESLSFDGTLAGTERSRRLTLTNGSGGSEFETLEDIRVGIDGEGLQVAHDCPARLGSKESCTIRVTAAPQTAGTLAGTLTVTTRDDTRRRTVGGSAVAALVPAAAAFDWQTGASGAFGAVATGESVTRTIGVVNRGSAAGRVTVSLSPTGSVWSMTDDCTANIAAGDACTVTIVFAPTQPERYEAAIEFTDAYRDGYAPARLELSGTGQ